MTRRSSRHDNAGVIQFRDDDQGYLQWLAGHQVTDAFVLNAERNPGPGYLVLHRATCNTINGQPAHGQQWTHDPIQICGARDALEAFAVRVGGTAQPCALCI